MGVRGEGDRQSSRVGEAGESSRTLHVAVGWVGGCWGSVNPQAGVHWVAGVGGTGSPVRRGAGALAGVAPPRGAGWGEVASLVEGWGAEERVPQGAEPEGPQRGVGHRQLEGQAE